MPGCFACWPCCLWLTGSTVSIPLQLTHWYPAAGGAVKCLGSGNDAFMRTLRPGQGWESPRPPFEVSLHVEARAASTSGRQEEGQSYFSSADGEPLICSLGSGQLPPGERVPRWKDAWL